MNEIVFTFKHVKTFSLRPNIQTPWSSKTNTLINACGFIVLRHSNYNNRTFSIVSQLEKYGIRGTALHLFQSYLSDRKPICKLQNTMSEVVDIACCIPQGSNLSPLLFLLYINDLPNCLEETQASMFATIQTCFIKVNRPQKLKTKLTTKYSLHCTHKQTNFSYYEIHISK